MKSRVFSINKRVMCVLTAISICLILLTGCGGGGGGGNETPYETPDNTAPYVVTVSPAVNQSDVGINCQLTVNFSEAMNNGTITGDTFKLFKGSDPINGFISYGTGSAIFTFWGSLEYATVYTAVVKSGVKDLAGNGLSGDYTWQFTTVAAPGPEIHVKKGTLDVVSGSTNVHDFGNVIAGNSSGIATFTVMNQGSMNLLLNGTPLVQSSSGEFVVESQPDASIAGGGSDDFTLSFNPTGTGEKTATITIYNNDGNENPYTFTVKGTATSAPEPEIHVMKGIIDVPSGTTNAHDFGSIIVGQTSSTVIFTVKNLGNADLNLTGAPHATSSSTEFSIYSQPNSPVGDGEETTFTVTFGPTGMGAKTATITIPNNDSNEGSYTFQVAGTGSPVPAPEINVMQGAGNLPSGGSFNFGGVPTNGTKSVAFTIQNLGNMDLQLNGTPRVEITGTDASMYQVESQPDSPVIANGNSTFIIKFQPTTAGMKNAVIRISNNDGDEGLYEITLTGRGSGCRMVKDINPGSGNSSITAFMGKVNNTVFFMNNGLWKTDGTAEGTVLVKSIYSNMNAVEFKGELYIAAYTGNVYHNLWKSDGTDTGTVMVKQISPTGEGGIHSNLYVAGNYICFLASDTAGGGNKEFWYSDGTESGTKVEECNTADINWRTLTSNPMILAVNDSYVYFTAWRRTEAYPFDKELYIFNNGTITRRDLYVGNESSSPQAIGSANNKFFFSIDTATGTQYKAADNGSIYNMGTFGVGRPVFANNSYWIWHYTEAAGVELYKSEYFNASYNLVKDINAGAGYSYPQSIVSMNGDIFFTATDGVHGNELWRSDGTDSGTNLVKDIFPGSSSGIGTNLYVLNNTLLIIADDGVHGAELWVSDGTESGTVLLRDINTGAGSSNISNMCVFNNRLYFTADDGINGAELWSTDGTETGTSMVMDINPGSGASSPSMLYNSGSCLHFVANDGSHGNELWIVE